MALIDLTSDLTWYGTPPAYDGVNNPQGIPGTNEHQAGFTPGRKQLDPTEFTGVTGASPNLSFDRPNVFSTVLGFTDNWLNNDATGFTPGRKQLDPTEFTGVTGGPGALEFSRPAIPNTIIGAYDGAFNPAGPPSSNVDQTGFTLGRRPLDPTEFTGVTGASPNLFFNRPSILNTVLGNVDYFNNAAARGFTPDLIHQAPSQFQGITISDWTYNYPATILSSYGFYNDRMPNKKGPIGSTVNTRFSPKYVPGGNVVGFQADGSRFSFDENTLRPYTKVPTVLGQGLDGPYKRKDAKNSFWIDDKTYNANGNASFLNQGGQGYPFPSFNGTQYNWKPNKHTGFNPNSRYGDVTANQTNNASNTNFGLADTYTTNSPIDDMYNKFVVRDEAFNPVPYAREPFILRGIQRPGKSENQRWGFGVNFDDGLIRGGIVTTTDRLVHDVLRIGKWLIKPKGILWMVKQFGLQQSNPTYEATSGGPGGNPLKQNHKIFTPINLVANVATNALGIHINRHGITPFDPIKDKYGDIFKGRSEATQNRLYQTAYGKFGMFGDNVAAVEAQQVGLPITNLLYINGPNSLYGIPGTSTLSFLGPKRATDTSLQAQFNGYQTEIPSLKDIKKKITPTTKKQADQKSWPGRWSYQDYKGVQYTHEEKYKENETPPETTEAEKEWLDDKKEGQSSQLITDVNESKPILNFGNAPVTPSKRNEIGDVQNYATVAYGKLPTKEKAITPSSFHDFRSLIDKPDSVKFMGSSKAAAYAEKNIQIKYGIPDSGKVGVDRSDFSKSTGLVDKINMLEPYEEYNKAGTKDFIKFIFRRNSKSANPIIFRAYLTNISDGTSANLGVETKNKQNLFGSANITSVSRTLDVSFLVAPSSKEELLPLWKKTDRLAQMVYPKYTNGVAVSNNIYVTIGDLYANLRGFPVDFNIQYDNETIWDIDREIPMNWEINLTINVFPERPGTLSTTNNYFTGLPTK